MTEKITVGQIVKVKPAKYGFTTMVKSKEHGDKKIFMISTKTEDSIKVGNTYEGEVTLWKKSDDGTEWMAWKWPKKEDTVMKELEIIKGSLSLLHAKIDEIGRFLVKPKDEIEYPEHTGGMPFPDDDEQEEVDKALDEYNNTQNV